MEFDRLSMLKPAAILALLLASFIILFSQAVSVCAEDSNQKVRVYGYVVDSETGKPIAGAKICVIHRGLWVRRNMPILWQENYGENLEVIAETNSSGLFEIYADRALLLYNPLSSEMVIFAYYDDNATLGMDYVPSYRLLHENGSREYYLEFSLLPGASIRLTGDPFFRPDEAFFSCEIVGEEISTVGAGIVTSFIAGRSLMGESRIMFVPANLEIKIRVSILQYSGRYGVYEELLNFTIPQNGSSLRFERGEYEILSLKEHRLRIEAYDNIPKFISYVRSLADKMGVLSIYERSRIQEAEILLGRARHLLSKGDYDVSQSDLYETYLILKDVENSLLSALQNSAASIYTLTPFIGISSSSLGSLLFRARRRRALASTLVYTILVLMLYYAYPGYIVAQEPEYNPLAGTPLEPLPILALIMASFLLGFMVINAPYTRGEKSDRRTLSLRSAIVSSFSLAAENLKRRRIRTFLVITMIAISILAFINLTSLSFEEGLVVEKARGTAPSDGIFICQRPANEINPYGPLDPEILEWLSRHENVCLVAPLLKTLPQVSLSPMPVGQLSTIVEDEGRHYNIFGVLGVKPSLEATITGLDKIIVAGRFLGDNDIDGILISDRASSNLEVDANNTVTFCGRTFRVVGIFDAERLKGINDLNGKPILPQNVRIIFSGEGPSYTSEYVSPEDVVIVLDSAALSLPLNVDVVRVVTRTLSDDQALPLARVLTLTFSRVEAFVSLGGVLKRLYIGHKLIAYGFAESSILLVLTSLNVGITLLNSVYERKREIMSLSTIGLNPTQIAAIFLCEALIMAFIAGSLGYLLGLTSYHVLFSLNLAPIVKYKAEASWCMLALLLSIVSSIVGSLIPALKASVKMTPSLLRRFVLPSKGMAGGDRWIVDVPLKITSPWDLKGFFLFMEKRMRDYSGPSQFEEKVEGVKLEGDINEPESLCLKFSYKHGSNYVNTENTLFATGDRHSGYVIKLSSRTPLSVYWAKENVWQTASFVRRLALEYTEKEKIYRAFPI